MPVIKPESDWIAEYGALPTPEEQDDLAKQLPDLEQEWRDYWRDSDKSVDLLERLYMFWNITRGRVKGD